MVSFTKIKRLYDFITDLEATIEKRRRNEYEAINQSEFYARHILSVHLRHCDFVIWFFFSKF